MKSLIGFFVAAFVCTHSSSLLASDRVINGVVVDPDEGNQVLRITSIKGGCTAALVGPRVILTSAHCVETGSEVSFTLAGKAYQAKMTRSALYSNRDHDLALGLIDHEINSVSPFSVGGEPKKTDELVMYGFGCIKAHGGGGNDGILRRGVAVVTGFSGFDVVATGSSAVCFGDSGGPALLGPGLVGVASKGDINTKSYFTNLASNESLSFLQSYARTNNVSICGINSNCP